MYDQVGPRIAFRSAYAERLDSDSQTVQDWWTAVMRCIAHRAGWSPADQFRVRMEFLRDREAFRTEVGA